MKYILKINAVVLAGYVLSLLLSKIGFPYLQYIFGLGLILLIGLNFTWFVESISGIKLKQAKLFLLATVLSAILLSTYSYIPNTKTSIHGLIIFNGLLYIVSLVFSALTLKINKNSPSKLVWPNRFAIILILTITILFCLNFLLYRYLPEADGYYYLSQIKQLTNGLWTQVSTDRTGFLAIVLSLEKITNIPPYWLLKVVMPLLTGLILCLPLYEISKKVFKEKILVFIFTLAPLTFPVIFMELLYTRPQTIFTTFLAVQLYILSTSINTKKAETLYIAVILTILSVLGIKIHEFFLFSLFLSLIALFYYGSPIIKKRPYLSTAVIAFCLILSYPLAEKLGIIGLFLAYAKPILRTLKDPVLNLWFIDSYFNFDKNQMGWPGLSFILYYLYNLGLFSLVIIFISLWTKTKKAFRSYDYLFYAIALAIFLSVAEILPRIGLAFLPERMWLFVSLSGAFLLPPLAGKAIRKKTFGKILVVSFFVISLLSSLFITYAKQGWTNHKEKIAADFIRENTPENSIIISQNGNFPMINYFADRYLLVPKCIFFGEDKNYQQHLVNNLEKIILKEDSIKDLKEKLLEQINQFNQGFDSQLLSKQQESINQTIKEIITNSKQTESKSKLFENTRNPSIYILYSKQKFTNLYNMREWWKNTNCHALSNNIGEAFNEYDLIYNQDDIYIWKVQ